MNDHYPQYLRDVIDTAEGRKPLVICSAGKTDKFDHLLSTAYLLQRPGQSIDLPTATCEDGQPHKQLVFGEESRVRKAVSTLERVQAGKLTRRVTQASIGHLLGYNVPAILAFFRSTEAAECPCDWCGGSPQPRTDHDDIACHARRTQYHA